MGETPWSTGDVTQGALCFPGVPKLTVDDVDASQAVAMYSWGYELELEDWVTVIRGRNARCLTGSARILCAVEGVNDEHHRQWAL